MGKWIIGVGIGFMMAIEAARYYANYADRKAFETVQELQEAIRKGNTVELAEEEFVVG